MTRDAWAFAIDPNHWIPLPPPDRLKEGRAKLWLDQALKHAAYANLATKDQLTTLRTRCEELLDQPRSDEATVFFPVMEPFPLVVNIETHDHDSWSARLDQWKREDEHTRTIEVTEVDHDHLAATERVMRVEQRGTRVHYSVGFFGRGEAHGLALTAQTVEPLVAGQFAGSGGDVFRTFRERETAA
ncbi:MAG: hypothetical protein CVT64_03140 [Actinobacteria bacterium HGW-Actinobacteria-4]|nr:MAG: hypothetical protein CVT64_03140 [Actinobacteria bacterium HGW-Actinobacteria-4]